MDFEKEIREIESKIEELKKFSDEKGIDLTLEIERLEIQCEETKKRVYSNLSPWDKVQVARHAERPYTLDYIENMTEGFVELHGDRLCGDDAAIVGGLCKIDGQRVMIVGHQKGRTIEKKLERNFGMANPEGYRKALRLFRMAERFNIPVVTLIDTPGAYPGLEAEKHGQGEAIARNLMEMAGIKTPMISIVIGEGGSGGALALGVTDRIYMLENAVYSVISPEGCAAILFKDASKSSLAADSLKISADSLYELEIIDGIIPEPLGGAHRDYEMSANNLKTVILSAISELKEISMDKLLENRYNKFRKIGIYSES